MGGVTDFAVPVVDIGPYVTGGDAAARADVARRMDEACRTVGFVQVLGHGVPESVANGLGTAIDDFFGRDLEEKKRYRVPGNRGYSPPKSERLSYSLGVESADRMNDFFEAFNVGTTTADHPSLDLDAEDYAPNTWPDVPGFQERVEAWFAEAGRVARTLTDVFADALGVPHAALDGITGHSVDVLRMNNYALPEGSIELDGWAPAGPGGSARREAAGGGASRGLTGMGEHTDFGIVTVLWADQVAGLQVLVDGRWHDVMPLPGALLVNLGDLTGRLTNDRWLSTLHRVKPPIIDGTIVRRRSAAFFHDGDIDAVIAPLPQCVGAEGPHYAPITVREHVAAKLAGSRAGVSNEAAGAEAQRVLAARG